MTDSDRLDKIEELLKQVLDELKRLRKQVRADRSHIPTSFPPLVPHHSPIPPPPYCRQCP